MAICSCGNEFPNKRKQLGYNTCLKCGSPKRNFIVVPVNKSNYVLGTMEDLSASYKSKGQSYG